MVIGGPLEAAIFWSDGFSGPMEILCFKKSAVFKNLETPSEQILTAQIFWPQDSKRFENAVF
jgi:hypothetical protein